jgi:hypothetical protein
LFGRKKAKKIEQKVAKEAKGTEYDGQHLGQSVLPRKSERRPEAEGARRPVQNVEPLGERLQRMSARENESQFPFVIFAVLFSDFLNVGPRVEPLAEGLQRMTGENESRSPFVIFDTFCSNSLM